MLYHMITIRIATVTICILILATYLSYSFYYGKSIVPFKEENDYVRLYQRLSIIQEMITGKIQKTEYMIKWFENFMLYDFKELNPKKRKAIKRKFKTLFSKDNNVTIIHPTTTHQTEEHQ